MTSEIWVWAWLPGDTEPTLAGRFRHTKLPGGGTPRYRGEFVYGRSYLTNPDALALDPVQLRLVDRVYETTALEGVFGPMRDAMPDDWGRYVIDRLFGPPADLTGYLLRGEGDSIGNLGFSTSREIPPKTYSLPGYDILPLTRGVLRGLQERRHVDPALVGLVRPNTNLGGARPKMTIGHEGKQWIAKYPTQEDHGAPIARVERAMLGLAQACGIRSVNTRVVEDDLLLVERFDRARSADGTGWRRDAFLSAQTVFHANVDGQAYAFTGSYARLSREMARFSETLAADRVELFRRMAFNCCISNTDDHERNHGFLAGDAPGLYTLSPAYDLVPRQHATRRREHALAIGEEGFVATRQNILSESAVFGLTRAQAEDILDEIAGTVQGRWKQGLMDEGIGEQEADDWAVCFTPLPDSL
ncbi:MULTISPECIES: HipA domain-containing protein [Cupriavidus]|jgi:serine/threonine-protein kinase HipA|uniref:type II toxin-antitoxin system HipA family toxin n=1 Tax=unclassified Cupriavidus TaxID=2640874 RepID=UPI003F90ABC5